MFCFDLLSQNVRCARSSCSPPFGAQPSALYVLQDQDRLAGLGHQRSGMTSRYLISWPPASRGCTYSSQSVVKSGVCLRFECSRLIFCPGSNPVVSLKDRAKNKKSKLRKVEQYFDLESETAPNET